MASQPSEPSINIADYRCHAFEYNHAATSRCDKCDKNGNKLLYKCIEHLKLICERCVEQGMVDERHKILLNIGHDGLPQPNLQEPRRQGMKRKSSKGPSRMPGSSSKIPKQGRRRHLNIVPDEEDKGQKVHQAKTSDTGPRGQQLAKTPQTYESWPISSRTRTSSAQHLSGLDETAPYERLRRGVPQEAPGSARTHFSSKARDVQHDVRSTSSEDQETTLVECPPSAGTDKTGLAFLLKAAEMESPEMMDVDDRTNPGTTTSPNTLQTEGPKTGSTIDYKEAQLQSAPVDSGPRKDIYNLRADSSEGASPTILQTEEPIIDLTVNHNDVKSRSTPKLLRPQNDINSKQHPSYQYGRDLYRPSLTSSRPSQQETSQTQSNPGYRVSSVPSTVRSLQMSPTTCVVPSHLQNARDNIFATRRPPLPPYRSEHDATRSHSLLAPSASASYHRQPQSLSRSPTYDAQPRRQQYGPTIMSSGFTPINASRPKSLAELTQFVIDTPLSQTRTRITAGPATHPHLAINTGPAQTLETDEGRSDVSELSPIPMGAITAYEAKVQEIEDQEMESQHDSYPRSGSPQSVETRVVAKRLKTLLRRATIVKNQGGVYSGSEMRWRR